MRVLNRIITVTLQRNCGAASVGVELDSIN